MRRTISLRTLMIAAAAAAWFTSILACQLPARSRSATSTPAVAIPVITQAVKVETQAAPATAVPPADTAVPPTAPAPTDTVVAPTTAPDVEFQGISFSFDKSIASSASGEVIPANPHTQDGPWWEVNPQYIQMSFKNYALQKTFHDPRIYVYPAKEFAAMSEEAKKTINELPGFLNQHPTNADQIPFLPPWNAAQVLRSNIQYLSFQNGKGVRFLSFYAQGISAINNHDLFYTFQGMTDDGNYYIAVVLPASNPVLPADGDQIPGGDFDTFSKNFNGYMKDITQKLNAQPDGSFSPDLSRLDAMIKTLKVK